MKTSDVGRKLIETFEGLRLTAYQDQGGVWTIGYGHTGDVYQGETITQAQADNYLGIDLHHIENTIYLNVKISLNQNQFDALVSLIYNIGGGNFTKSTLLKLLNNSDFMGAGNQFLVWDKVGGIVNSGLAARRVAERQLFLKAVNSVLRTT